MSHIWTCPAGHSVLEGHPRVCPWCRIAELERERMSPPSTDCEQCSGARYTTDGLPCTACNAMGEAPAAYSKSQHKRIAEQRGDAPTHHYALWRHLRDEHGLTLLESELDEIARIAAEASC